MIEKGFVNNTLFENTTFNDYMICYRWRG